MVSCRVAQRCSGLCFFYDISWAEGADVETLLKGEYVDTCSVLEVTLLVRELPHVSRPVSGVDTGHPALPREPEVAVPHQDLVPAKTEPQRD